MRKFLTTTAIGAMLALGFAETASAVTAIDTQNICQAVQTQIRQNVLSIEQNLHRGDFQMISSATTNQDLYTGMGSALMGSIRMFRF